MTTTGGKGSLKKGLKGKGNESSASIGLKGDSSKDLSLKTSKFSNTKLEKPKEEVQKSKKLDIDQIDYEQRELFTNWTAEEKQEKGHVIQIEVDRT